jgi:hypothetical protein
MHYIRLFKALQGIFGWIEGQTFAFEIPQQFSAKGCLGRFIHDWSVGQGG